MVITTVEFYTLGKAASTLATNRRRIRQLVELAGIRLMEVGGAKVMTRADFGRLRAAHKSHPMKRPGRPRKSSSDPSSN